VIPATVRDATYVLDAILDNETELTILEHATDTAGTRNWSLPSSISWACNLPRACATLVLNSSIG
jgi:hypothetical protein